MSRGYGGERFSFGRDYIIPKPFDPRVLLWVAPAVAEAAISSGVARLSLDLTEYRERLKKRQSRLHGVMSLVHAKARTKLAKIVFPEGDNEKIQHAAQILREEGLCEPILLGPVQKIRASIEERRLDGLEGVQVILPEESPDYDRYVARFWELRARKGMTFAEARRQVRARNYYASVMVERGDADGMVTGLTVGYPDGIRAPLEIIGTRKGRRAAGVYIVVTKEDFKFFADTTVNIDPNPQALADIAVATADLARYFDVVPRVAMLSYSSFGAAKGESPAKVRKATELVRQMRPDLEVDGEIQVDIATDAELRVPEFPFSTLKEDANVFVFPNLDSANISYQLLEAMGGAEVIGPVLLGMDKPVNVLQMGTSVQSIVNLAAITALGPGRQGEQCAVSRRSASRQPGRESRRRNHPPRRAGGGPPAADGRLNGPVPAEAGPVSRSVTWTFGADGHSAPPSLLSAPSRGR